MYKSTWTKYCNDFLVGKFDGEVVKATAIVGIGDLKSEGKAIADGVCDALDANGLGTEDGSRTGLEDIVGTWIVWVGIWVGELEGTRRVVEGGCVVLLVGSVGTSAGFVEGLSIGSRNGFVVLFAIVVGYRDGLKENVLLNVGGLEDGSTVGRVDVLEKVFSEGNAV
jgi:hypothetical protein